MGKSGSAVAGVAKAFVRDFSLSALVAGFVTVLVAVASSAAIVFQAAQAMGASPEQVVSWIWAICIGVAITTVVLSLRYRMPIITTWSTPGAATLVAGNAGLPFEQAVGGFAVCAILMMLAGFSGWFERSLGRVPVSLANGLLAGVLLRFGLDAFVAIQARPALVLAMLAAYLLGRRLFPRYAALAALAAGVAVAAASGLLHLERVQAELAVPVFTMPSLSWPAVFGIALPLFVVTMTSQNLTGVAMSRAAGFDIPVSRAVGWTSTASLLLAPFGAFALNLAAVSAAICLGREAHAEPCRRYVAAVCAGVFYLLLGVFAPALTGLLAAFPSELVMAIAGIALLGTIGNSLAGAMADEVQREPALVTFLVTVSGVSFWGVGSAFWGLLAGVLVLAVLRRGGR